MSSRTAMISVENSTAGESSLVPPGPLLKKIQTYRPPMILVRPYRVVDVRHLMRSRSCPGQRFSPDDIETLRAGAIAGTPPLVAGARRRIAG